MGAPAQALAEDSALGVSRRSPLAIRLLGPLTVEPAGSRPRRASTDACVAILALRPAGATRDELVEALWPGCDPVLGRQRLWQSASEARRLLLGPALVRERERYLLDRARVWIDVDELEKLVAQSRRAAADEAAALDERAFSLFRGEPFAGCDYLWAELERRRLQAVLVELAARVGRSRMRIGFAEALAACERGLAVDPLNERLARLAMEAEAELGLRTAITERYEALRRRLSERLGLEPERETRALYRALLAQK